jgi:hypothetical protein
MHTVPLNATVVPSRVPRRRSPQGRRCARPFPRVPVAGFLTYGEIARLKGRMDG